MTERYFRCPNPAACVRLCNGACKTPQSRPIVRSALTEELEYDTTQQPIAKRFANINFKTGEVTLSGFDLSGVSHEVRHVHTEAVENSVRAQMAGDNRRSINWLHLRAALEMCYPGLVK